MVRPGALLGAHAGPGLEQLELEGDVAGDQVGRSVGHAEESTVGLQARPLGVVDRARQIASRGIERARFRPSWLAARLAGRLALPGS
jgi:hypothetical protein